MHQPVRAANIHKGAKAGNGNHAAGVHLPGRNCIHGLLAAHSPRFFAGRALRNNQPVALRIGFLQNFDHNRFAGHAAPALGRSAANGALMALQPHLRRWQERTLPGKLRGRYNQAAFVEVHNLAGDGQLLVEQLIEVAPVAHLAHARHRHQDAAIVVFRFAKHLYGDNGAHLQRVALRLRQRCQLLLAQHAFALGANLNQNFGGRDARNPALAHFARFGQRVLRFFVRQPSGHIHVFRLVLSRINIYHYGCSAPVFLPANIIDYFQWRRKFSARV